MIFTRYFKFTYTRAYKRIDKTKASEIIDQIKHITPGHFNQYDFLLYIINKVIYIKLI